MDAIEERKKDGEILRIFQDESPESPRTWDNLGNMVCWHRRYNLGDEQPKISAQDYFEGYIKDETVYLPLYLYDHSGITMNTTGFHSHWDSGKVGWIYVSFDRIKEEYGDITEETLAKVKKYLEGEVKTFDQYISGQVYGYEIVKEIKCECCFVITEEQIDSCWGFFGDTWEKSGIFESIDKKWKEA